MCVKVFGNVCFVWHGERSLLPLSVDQGCTWDVGGVQVGGVGVSDASGVRVVWLLSLKESWAEWVRHSGTLVGPVL